MSRPTVTEAPMQRIQHAMSTALMRDMILLQAARSALQAAGIKRPRILSFGCSRGDELVTLRLLFPDCELHGCDIQPPALAAARAVDGFAEVFLSDPAEIRSRGPFDLVVALSSLCRHPAPEPAEMAIEFPFSAFDDTVSLLTETLSDGGIFALYNSAYPFRFTSTSKGLSVLRSDRLMGNGYCTVFAPGGERLLKAGATFFELYYCLEAIGPLVDTDLYDCLFRKGGAVSITLPIPHFVDWQTVATWKRDHLAGISDAVRNLCLARETHYQGLVNPENGEFVILSTVRQANLARDGFIERGPIVIRPGPLPA